MSSSRSPASYSSHLGRRTMTLSLEGWVVLSEGVPPAEPLRSYWHSYAFYAITPGAGGLEAGFVGCQSLEETSENLLPAYLQGVPLWVVEGMLADTRQWGCLGSRCSPSLLLLPDVSGECLHSYRVWTLTHRRRISRAIQGELSWGCAFSCEWQGSLGHLWLWGSLCLVLGWADSKLFSSKQLTSQMGSLGLGKLTVEQASFRQTWHRGSGSLRERAGDFSGSCPSKHF